MHVLITGGAGFIGSHTARALLAEGHQVTVLDNFSSGKRSNLPDHHDALRIVTGDIGDESAVSDALDGATHVLHLAAQVSVAASVEAPLPSCRDNVLGFLTVFDGARRAGITRFVYASSAAVYGTPAELPLNEASPTGPLSPYGLEKLINDQYAALYQNLYGMSPLGMRYFNVYGPGQDPSSPYSGVISRFVDGLKANRPLTVFGDGGQTRDFVYVGDVAQANLAALATDCTGVCNVGTGSTVTLLQLIDALAAVAGVSPEVHHAPAREGDIRHSATAIERMRRDLGAAEPTPLADGLARLWQSC